MQLIRARVNILKKDYLSPNSVHFILHPTLARHQTKKIGKGVQRVDTKQILGSLSPVQVLSVPAKGGQSATLGPKAST